MESSVTENFLNKALGAKYCFGCLNNSPSIKSHTCLTGWFNDLQISNEPLEIQNDTNSSMPAQILRKTLISDSNNRRSTWIR